MPSSDGFPFKFAQCFWPNFREELLSLFGKFNKTVKFDQRFYSSFITLILKVENPSIPNDFRSISLLVWVHKLITRVLSARLKCVMGKLVRDSQLAFIKGRSIFEGWTVVA